MNEVGVIDRFLAVFTQYIDSGFGLLSGEVAFLATTLIVIDVTLAALFWSWGADDDIIARLVKKTLFVGIFAYIIGNWSALANIVFNSFAGLGLKASGSGLLSTIGSLGLCRSLLRAGLVDRFRVGIFPVITGATGAERIYDGYPDVALEMIDHRTFDGRIQMVEYRPRVLDRPPLAPAP